MLPGVRTAGITKQKQVVGCFPTGCFAKLRWRKRRFRGVKTQPLPLRGHWTTVPAVSAPWMGLEYSLSARLRLLCGGASWGAVHGPELQPSNTLQLLASSLIGLGKSSSRGTWQKKSIPNQCSPSFPVALTTFVSKALAATLGQKNRKVKGKTMVPVMNPAACSAFPSASRKCWFERQQHFLLLCLEKGEEGLLVRLPLR